MYKFIHLWVWVNTVTSLNYLQNAALKTIYWTPINSSGMNHNGCFMSNFINIKHWGIWGCTLSRTQNN